MAEKLYPFSVQKHAHDIEYLRNYTKNRIGEIESGEVEYDGKRLEWLESRLEKLDSLLDAILGTRDGRVAWLTGKQYGMAREAMLWASEMRASHCKPEYRQYC